ncbi:MAG: (2Fe-2S)-binding protein [Thiobacillaceae bacterium]
MYICICRQVTDRDIREAVTQGACRMRDLRQQLGLGEQCGRCAECAHSVLKQARQSCSPEACNPSA